MYSILPAAHGVETTSKLTSSPSCTTYGP
jgi:hypothetical protein